MKASAVKAVAQDYTVEQIDAAIEGVTEREELLIPVEGDDLGEKLTHLLLGRRLAERVAGGEPFKEAFRALMSEVRGTLANE